MSPLFSPLIPMHRQVMVRSAEQWAKVVAVRPRQPRKHRWEKSSCLPAPPTPERRGQIITADWGRRLVGGAPACPTRQAAWRCVGGQQTHRRGVEADRDGVDDVSSPTSSESSNSQIPGRFKARRRRSMAVVFDGGNDVKAKVHRQGIAEVVDAAGGRADGRPGPIDLLAKIGHTRRWGFRRSIRPTAALTRYKSSCLWDQKFQRPGRVLSAIWNRKVLLPLARGR